MGSRKRTCRTYTTRKVSEVCHHDILYGGVRYREFILEMALCFCVGTGDRNLGNLRVQRDTIAHVASWPSHARDLVILGILPLIATLVWPPIYRLLCSLPLQDTIDSKVPTTTFLCRVCINSRCQQQDGRWNQSAMDCGEQMTARHLQTP